MKNLKIFLSYYKAHWKLFLGDMICAVIVALVDTVFPMMSKYTLDAIIPSFELNLLFKMILVMTLMYVVRTVAFWFINYWGHVFGTKVEADMRRDIFSHIEYQDLRFLIIIELEKLCPELQQTCLKLQNLPTTDQKICLFQF